MFKYPGSGISQFIFCLTICFVFVVIMAFYVKVILPFKKKRDYIKMEMARSDKREFGYWKQVLRDFYISRIPIIGRIILKYGRKP